MTYVHRTMFNYHILESEPMKQFSKYETNLWTNQTSIIECIINKIYLKLFGIANPLFSLSIYPLSALQNAEYLEIWLRDKKIDEKFTKDGHFHSF